MAKTRELGIPLVNEDWLGKCVEEGCAQDYHDFLILHKESSSDNNKENHQLSSDENFGHGRSTGSEEGARQAGSGCLFKGYTFSMSACKQMDELTALICSEGGRVVKDQTSDFQACDEGPWSGLIQPAGCCALGGKEGIRDLQEEKRLRLGICGHLRALASQERLSQQDVSFDGIQLVGERCASTRRASGVAASFQPLSPAFSCCRVGDCVSRDSMDLRKFTLLGSCRSF